MEKGLEPSFVHFLIIWQTLSTICRWLQWLKICLAICREVSRESYGPKYSGEAVTPD